MKALFYPSTLCKDILERHTLFVPGRRSEYFRTTHSLCCEDPSLNVDERFTKEVAASSTFISASPEDPAISITHCLTSMICVLLCQFGQNTAQTRYFLIDEYKKFITSFKKTGYKLLVNKIASFCSLTN